MRRAWMSVVLVGLAAACSGVEDAPPLTTVASAVTEAPAPTDPPATDPPALETTTTTVAPTTTIDEEAAEVAAIEQAAIDAYDAYHAAILDPSNPDRRAEIEATHGDPALSRVLQTLDDLVTLNQIARPHADLVPTVEVVGDVRFIDDERTFADLIVCELNPEKIVEIGALPDGGDSFVRDDIFTVKNVQEFDLIGGAWKFTAGESISVLVGDLGCE